MTKSDVKRVLRAIVTSIGHLILMCVWVYFFALRGLAPGIVAYLTGGALFVYTERHISQHPRWSISWWDHLLDFVLPTIGGLVVLIYVFL